MIAAGKSQSSITHFTRAVLASEALPLSVRLERETEPFSTFLRLHCLSVTTQARSINSLARSLTASHRYMRTSISSHLAGCCPVLQALTPSKTCRIQSRQAASLENKLKESCKLLGKLLLVFRGYPVERKHGPNGVLIHLQNNNRKEPYSKHQRKTRRVQQGCSSTCLQITMPEVPLSKFVAISQIPNQL